MTWVFFKESLCDVNTTTFHVIMITVAHLSMFLTSNTIELGSKGGNLADLRNLKTRVGTVK